MDDMHPARPTRRHRRIWVLAALVLVPVLFVLLFDANWFRGTIERRVTDATGREFSIGDLHVGFDGWFRLELTASDVRLQNWSGRDPEQMFTAESIRLQPRVWPLLSGIIVLRELHAEAPHIVLQREADGKANWNFRDAQADDDAGTGDLPRIDFLQVDRGRLELVEADTDTRLDIAIDSGEPRREDAAAPLMVSGGGQFRGADFAVDGAIESPLALQDEEARYRLRLAATAGDTTARIRGALLRPLQPRDFRMRFELEGNDLSDLYPLIGISLPATPSYRLQGVLSRDDQLWRYREIEGEVGDSDLGGEASLDMAPERPLLHARLTSQTLDFYELSGFIGVPPNGQAIDNEDPTADEAFPDGQVLPHQEYSLERLRSMDADVILDATRLRAPPLPLDSLAAHLKLIDGQVNIEPLTVGVADGEISGRITLDAQQDPIAMDVDLRMRQLSLPELFAGARIGEGSSGRIHGRIDLAGRGNSIGAMLGSSSGEVGLAMGRARVSNLLLEFAGLDIAEALEFLLGEDEAVPVRCAFADFEVEDGLMTARTFGFDSSDTVLHGEGTIDLGSESLDLKLQPRPRDASPLSLRSPLVVTGSFVDPSFRPAAGPLLLRGAAAAALYAIAPPAALLALIETGPGEDTECGGEGDEVDNA